MSLTFFDMLQTIINFFYIRSCLKNCASEVIKENNVDTFYTDMHEA